MDITTAFEIASVEANKHAEALHAVHGDGFPCGFAWVSAPGVKGNTKLGRALKQAGFRKAYTGGLQLWNPSGSFVQNVDIKVEGAQRFAEVFERLTGVKLAVESRLD